MSVQDNIMQRAIILDRERQNYTNRALSAFATVCGVATVSAVLAEQNTLAISAAVVGLVPILAKVSRISPSLNNNTYDRGYTPTYRSIRRAGKAVSETIRPTL